MVLDSVDSIVVNRISFIGIKVGIDILWTPSGFVVAINVIVVVLDQ